MKPLGTDHTIALNIIEVIYVMNVKQDMPKEHKEERVQIVQYSLIFIY